MLPRISVLLISSLAGLSKVLTGTIGVLLFEMKWKVNRLGKTAHPRTKAKEGSQCVRP